MYTVVLMAVMSGGVEAPDFHLRHSCTAPAAGCARPHLHLPHLHLPHLNIKQHLHNVHLPHLHLPHFGKHHCHCAAAPAPAAPPMGYPGGHH